MKSYIFKKKFTVYFGDTDAAGVVHHARYIYWLEATRIDFLTYLGCSYKYLQDLCIGLMPIDINISYHYPLRFADMFYVEITKVLTSKASISIFSDIVHHNRKVNSSVVKLACINENTWRPIKLPTELVSKCSPYIT